jgi:hypothetical protein
VILLLHTMFALYKELKKGWKKIVRAFWKKVCGTESMPKNLLDSRDAPQRCDTSDARIAPYLMIHNWLFGSIGHKVFRNFSAYGQGLLQHDKARSEGEYYRVKFVVLGGIRLELRRYLPDCRSSQVLARFAHAVGPGLRPSHWHTRVSMSPPTGSIFPNDGRPEEDGNKLA